MPNRDATAIVVQLAKEARDGTGIELEVEWIRMVHDLDLCTRLYVFDEAGANRFT